MDRDSSILLENAFRDGEIQRDRMLRLYAGWDAANFADLADALVGQGLLEPSEAGAYRITHAGRDAWKRRLAAERAEVVRSTGTWQPQ